jgi:hypothetical protein
VRRPSTLFVRLLSVRILRLFRGGKVDAVDLQGALARVERRLASLHIKLDMLSVSKRRKLSATLVTSQPERPPEIHPRR